MKTFYLLIVFCALSIFANAKTVYFVPCSGINPAKLFYEPHHYRDEVSIPFIRLREGLEKAGYNVQFTHDGAQLPDMAAIVVLTDFSQQLLCNLLTYPKKRCILLIFEPPVVAPHLYSEDYTPYFGEIFTMFDDVVDNKKYFKFHYPQPRSEMMADIPDFDQKKLCAMIANNKGFAGHQNANYVERRTLSNFFHHLNTDDFDLYGSGWEGFRNSRGTVASKWDTLKNYKFHFSYENMYKQLGYVTEKIFDPMVAGCVPVYLGASNITDYVPAECFIDRRSFSSDEALYQFLKNMDRDTYNQYIQAIQAFLKGPKGRLFSTDHFVEFFVREIEQMNK